MKTNVSIANNSACNFQKEPIVDASRKRHLLYRIAKKIPNKLFTLQGRIKYRAVQWDNRTASDKPVTKSLNLRPGEWVKVRSLTEIALTLDKNGKYRGLYFMPEMEQFCGGKYKVFKKAEKIKMESTGELRKLKSPSYFLEGVYCTGEFQGGCDRSCFHFWREEWLEGAIEQT
ncbi:hypothetical protein [Gaoshiqia sediminis]|uniref:Uncharacterized protein n=1 Tax=Gaoshiqia sediminis TaxID=2986998 RepID=A0AA41Y956_9BACT|nr:hypothetical protein [Gaoshiqia sediminis]MCW0481673.1 hypothetical protein [Gaoshiqia sediminis]